MLLDDHVAGAARTQAIEVIVRPELADEAIESGQCVSVPQYTGSDPRDVLKLSIVHAQSSK